MRSQFSYTYRHLELTIITKDFPVLIRITKPEPKLKGIPVFGYAGMIRNVCKNVLDESFQPFFFYKRSLFKQEGCRNSIHTQIFGNIRMHLWEAELSLPINKYIKHVCFE